MDDCCLRRRVSFSLWLNQFREGDRKILQMPEFLEQLMAP
jgi:hypothetical protein